MDSLIPALNRVLIVDDDPGLGRTLLAILQKSGHEGRWVSKGKEAIELFTQSPTSWNIILIDLRLPDTSGIDVLREVKQRNPDIGAIMITGHADIDTALSALNEGAFAYIQKPYNIEEVRLILKRLTEKQKLVWENRDLLTKTVQLNAELENRVRQRTGDLQTANLKLAAIIEELQKADAVKSEFISMVSHELRTPLTVIIGSSKLLLDQFRQMAEESIRHCIEMIVHDAQRLSRLVEEILDLSRIQKKGLTLHYEKLDLQALAESVIEALRLTYPDRRFEVAIEPQARQLSGDRDRTQQIFLNVLSNAAKYSPKGGLVRVEGCKVKDRICLRVMDSGCGIPLEHRDKIFEAFYRTGDAVNLRSPGTGLGLTITKAIVEAMAGHISVEGRPDGGSVFQIELPIALPSDHQERSAA